MSLYLLTAPSGAGKTTFCAALAEQARAAGWDMAGILSPPIFENGQKVGILAQNLRTGETRPLAQLLPSPSGRGVGGEGLPSPAGSPAGVLREGAGGEGLPSPAGSPAGVLREGAGGEGLPSPSGRGAGSEGLPSPTGRRAGSEGLPSPTGRGVGGEGLPSPTGRGAGGEGLPLGRWLFSPSALAWGNDLLASCLPADLFIVDELGPLELIRGEGWVNALEALRSGRYKIGLVVIRPELVETGRQILPVEQVIPFTAWPAPSQQAQKWWENRIPMEGEK